MNETTFTDLPGEAADATRRTLWQHFVHPDNQMFYDYWWGVSGFPHLPTPDQIAKSSPMLPAGNGHGELCTQCRPSPAGSVTAARTGARRAHGARGSNPFPRTAAIVRRSQRPGVFCHAGWLSTVSATIPILPPTNTTMVLYALHAYAGSGVATAAEQSEVRNVWQEVLARWERAGWEDRREDGGQAIYGDMNSIASDRSGRLLAALLGGYVMTGDRHWHSVYRQKLEEQDYARLRTGLPPESAALYVYDQNQVAWRLLWELEEDADLRLRYREFMTETANSVVARLPDYRQFDTQEHARMLAASTWDWRAACLPPSEGPNHGARYNARLRQLAPASAYEHKYVQGPWEAAHILSLSEAPVHHRLLREHLPLLLTTYPCDHLALSWSIYDVEWTYWMVVQRTGDSHLIGVSQAHD